MREGLGEADARQLGEPAPYLLLHRSAFTVQRSLQQRHALGLHGAARFHPDEVQAAGKAIRAESNFVVSCRVLFVHEQRYFAA